MKRLFYLLCITLCLVSCNRKQETKDTDEQEIRTEKDLEGKVVGTLTGTCFEIDFAGRSDFRLVRQPTLSDLIASLRKGRIDAILYDEISLPDTLLHRYGIKMAFST